MKKIALPFRLAFRELRGSRRGFGIFLTCLILGVTMLTSVRMSADIMLGALEKDAQAILGGDLKFTQKYKPLPDSLYQSLKERGITETAEQIQTRAMLRTDQDAAGEAVLVELKAITENYPLYGTLQVADEQGNDLTSPAQKLYQSAAPLIYLDQGLVDQLSLHMGQKLYVGQSAFEYAGTIIREPDALSGGRPALAPRVIISIPATEEAGLLGYGSMSDYILLTKTASPHSADAVLEELKTLYPEQAWDMRSTKKASSQMERLINRLVLFLTMLGLTALLVGGVGIGNAVKAFMDTRIKTIATFKCLGASTRLIFVTYLFQILLVASFGILLSMILSSTIAAIIVPLLNLALPFQTEFLIRPSSLIYGAVFGYLTVILFTLIPLGRACATRAADLFREDAQIQTIKPDRTLILGCGVAALALLNTALFGSPDKFFALGFTATAAGVLLFFYLMGYALRFVTRFIPKPKNTALNLARLAVIRPGSPAAQVTLSLGLGLTVLVALAQIETNFTRNLTRGMNDTAPSFFFLDIQKDQKDDFASAVTQTAGAEDLLFSPNIRGRIVAVNGGDPESALVDPDERWLLNNDRGLTYTDTLPENSNILEGAWWNENHPVTKPSLSVVEDVRDAFDVHVGDTISVNILGRVIEAEIVNVRSVNWMNYTINFALTFAPGSGLEDAPFNYLATVRVPPSEEARLQRDLAAKFPNVTIVRLRTVLEEFANVMGKVGIAVRISAGLALVTGVLVLAGAISATREQRIRDSVIMKVLGARRPTLRNAYLFEYLYLGLATALAAGLIGTVCAWAMITQILDLSWEFQIAPFMTTLSIAFIITVILGWSSTGRVLKASPINYLRNDLNFNS
ncbi:MAG: ABC transporter permease [Pseudobdellovibrionaceae bacterium]